MLGELGIEFLLIVLNDGSCDGTADALKAFASDPRVCVLHQSNAGHGPTVLRGYEQAVGVGEWVFQCDSDDDTSPVSFPEFWNRRHEYDAILGQREGRRQDVVRRAITFGSYLMVRLLFGAGIRDVNVPYRLIGASILRPLIETMPPNAFAPNVLLSAALVRRGVRIGNVPIRHQARQSGRSIQKWRLWKGTLLSFWQMLRYRAKV
jgi:glycosyltransferase involved in cell wall biosynthesis